MYRKVDPEKNVLPPSDDEVPQVLRDYMEKANAAEAEKKRLEKLEREMCKFSVTYNGVTKNYSRHESVTVGQLKADVLKDFECTSSPEDARLTLFDNYYKKDTPLEDDKALEKCDISYWSNKMTLETKEPGKEWTVINPNEITIHIYYEDAQTKEGQTEEAEPVPIDQMKLVSFDLKIDKSCHVSDLRKMVADQFNVEPNTVRLIKKGYSSYYGPETIKYDSDTMMYARIDDDDSIYAEPCTYPMESANLDNSRIFTYLDSLSNQVTYHIVCEGRETFDITFDQRRSLKELKELLSEKLGIPIDSLMLKRGSTTYKTELTDMNKSTKDHFLYNNSDVFVEEGVVGSHSTRVYLWRPETNKAELLFRVNVIETELISDFISRIAAKYNQQYGEKPDYPHPKDSSCFYLREYNYEGYFPTGYYTPSAIVKSAVSWLSDDTKFMLEILSEPKELPEPSNVVHIYCYEWHPSTITVDEVATEILVKKDAPINDIRRSLAKIHREPPQQPKEEKKEEQSNTEEEKKEEQPKAEVKTEEKKEEEPNAEVKEEEKMEEEPAGKQELLPEDVCITTLTGYGRIGAPSVKKMISSVDEAPAWKLGETVTPNDIKELYLRNGITIAFWNKAEPLKELTAEEKARIENSDTSSSYSYSSSS